MNDIEQVNTQLPTINNQLSLTKQHRRSQRQRISPEPQSVTTINPVSTIDRSDSSQSFRVTDNKNNQVNTTMLPSAIIDVNPLNDRSKLTNNHLQRYHSVDQQNRHSSDSLNNLDDDELNLSHSSAPSNSLLKHNLSMSDLDPLERKKQIALIKAEDKLEKAQRLFDLAQQSIEQSISEFLRATTMPNVINESNSSKSIIAPFEKRIRTLQETKKKLEKKISKYQNDITRIQSGDIPHQYRLSKDIINNIKNKVSNGTSKNRLSNLMSTPILHEQTITSSLQETDNYNNQSNSGTNQNNETTNNNNNLNFLSYSQNSGTFDNMRPSPSSSISNEMGNSQFYIDSNSDASAANDIDKSPSSRRRLTDDSNLEFNDQISDHSTDDRLASNASSKRITITTAEYHQLITKIDSMHKIIDRYDTKVVEMQKQMESLISVNDSQNERNERLNTDLTDLIDIHQGDISSMKTDLRKLEEKLLWNLNEYWTEIIERLDKLDTRTTKVEQTQAHSFETEENTHRLISKFVNILLTAFAIILLLLSTIKNLLQSRVHAIILLILVFTWIIIHYSPENYFQRTFWKSVV